LHGILRITDESDAVQCLQRVELLLRDRPELLKWAPLLGPVLPRSLPESDATRALDGRRRTELMHTTLVAVLRGATAIGPLMIVLDDAHLMDPESWQLGLDVADNVAALLLVMSTYPLSDTAPPAAASLLAAPGTTTVRLGRLSASDVRAVVCDSLGVKHIAEPALELISAKSDGHPLLCIEYARALLDQGIVAVKGGECRLLPDQDPADVAMPSAVQAILSTRLDRLTPPERLALKVASVVGREFRFQTVHDCLPSQEGTQDLHRVLGGLERQGLIEPLASGEGECYAFRSAACWEAVYATLLFAQRRQLHRAVAEWYECTCGSDQPRYYRTLAHHWRAADDPAKAIEYLEQAGQQAAREGAYDEADRFFRESIELNAAAAVLSDRYYDGSRGRHSDAAK
jgi:predicted ATPase